MSATQATLEAIRERAAADRRYAAMDALLDLVDNMMLDGRFDALDALLREVRLSLGCSLTVALLGFTWVARERLPSRQTLLDSARAEWPSVPFERWSCG